ncbi:hypothetical protein ACFVH7_02485 [Kitasatospora indigofera]|uniref:hypothetical protein n=1 Tax=Kitasatospora indigofera TaxID=67307 RepID=UPI003641299D
MNHTHGPAYGGGAPLPQAPAWSVLDEYLWHSCEILADLRADRLDQRPLVATRARLEPGERALAVGPAHRLSWRPLGDGSYQHNSTFAIGGPAFVIGALAASAIGNANRRRNAELAARPRWLLDGTGEITITDRHVFFGHPQCPLHLSWDGLESVELAGPDLFEAGFHDIYGGGYTTVQLQTPWASLMFVCAALTSFPAHPRLLTGGWLPPGFEQRCAQAGRPFRPAAGLSTGPAGPAPHPPYAPPSHTPPPHTPPPYAPPYTPPPAAQPQAAPATPPPPRGAPDVHLDLGKDAPPG